jgi:S1-C subfamily serine protease
MLRGRDGLGLGDAKLMAAAAAWLGWLALPGVVVMGAVTALVFAVSARFSGRAIDLGTERHGNGIVIDDNGLVLTIGYIILEAVAVSVVDADGNRVPAAIIAYDYDTGFGLVRAASSLAATPIRLGDSGAIKATDRVMVVSAGGAANVAGAFVVTRDVFAGYWEYLLDQAIFTAPVYEDWAGAALVGPDGKLLGVGSLYIEDTAADERTLPGNMFVPINLLKPILSDLLADGRAAGPPRPWMGLFTRDIAGHVVVISVIPEGPGKAASMVAGEVIDAVAGEAVVDMADLFRKVWKLGSAGVDVPLTVNSEAGSRRVVVKSVDRYEYLRLDPTY